MPKLGRYSPVLDSVFFLYKTKEDAEKGVYPQASGFLVAMPSSENKNYFHVHGITNWHVAIEYEPASCIRINTYCGKPAVFDFDASEWFFIPNCYDIAISPPLLIDRRLHKVNFLDVDSFFLTEDQEAKDEIGPAEDVFMVGLFLDYFGNEVHTPSVRFGHISIMNAQVNQLTNYMGRSIILDMNSRTGFSGSPVFVYRTLGSHFLEQSQPGQILTGGGHYMKLLGIHWGQFPELWELKEPSSTLIAHKASLVIDGKYVFGLSGMTTVIPSACILEVLNLPELQKERTIDNGFKK